MKKFTQKQFDALPRNEYGVKECPTGDYTAIKSFGECCSFGEWCSFGKCCSFGKGCVVKSPFWSFVYEPPFKTEGKIYPPETTREYWQERLGLDLSGCYKEIYKRIKPQLKEMLKRTDLTKCERRILESWL